MTLISRKAFVLESIPVAELGALELIAGVLCSFRPCTVIFCYQIIRPGFGETADAKDKLSVREKVAADCG